LSAKWLTHSELGLQGR